MSIAEPQRYSQVQAEAPIVELVEGQTVESVGRVARPAVEMRADAGDVVSGREAQIGKKQVLLINQVKLAELQVLAGEQQFRPLCQGLVYRHGPVRLICRQSGHIDGHEAVAVRRRHAQEPAKLMFELENLV